MPRIVTYNVHRCLGKDGVTSVSRIAAVIASLKPDIIALQELDVGRKRSQGVDQAREIARELGHEHIHFHPALRVMEEAYGDAIITQQPSRLIKTGMLPLPARRPSAEPRGALWAAIRYGENELQVINTHLGLGRGERLKQIEELLGPAWLSHADCAPPVILLGDFNSAPRGRAYRMIASRLSDAQLSAGPAHPTFPTRYPLLRIDHVFAGPGITVLNTEVPTDPLTLAASDHLPLCVDFELVAPAGTAPAGNHFRRQGV
jgi:endonuclease/exonuclease/phosphatase family metal-dependent hydrolase